MSTRNGWRIPSIANGYAGTCVLVLENADCPGAGLVDSDFAYQQADAIARASIETAGGKAESAITAARRERVNKLHESVTEAERAYSRVSAQIRMEEERRTLEELGDNPKGLAARLTAIDDKIDALRAEQAKAERALQTIMRVFDTATSEIQEEVKAGAGGAYLAATRAVDQQIEDTLAKMVAAIQPLFTSYVVLRIARDHHLSSFGRFAPDAEATEIADLKRQVEELRQRLARQTATEPVAP
jgi:superfamily II RNA helicase